jgi:hypothetical protein
MTTWIYEFWLTTHSYYYYSGQLLPLGPTHVLNVLSLALRTLFIGINNEQQLNIYSFMHSTLYYWGIIDRCEERKTRYSRITSYTTLSFCFIYWLDIPQYFHLMFLSLIRAKQRYYLPIDAIVIVNACNANINLWYTW